MKLTRTVRCGFFLALSLVYLAAAVFLFRRLNNPDLLETTYHRMNQFLLLSGLVLSGLGVYAVRELHTRNRDARVDALLLMAVGFVVLLEWIVILIFYGGIEDSLLEADYVAVNLAIITLSVLPAVFLIRAVILAVSLRDAGSRGKLILRVCCGVLAAGYVAGIAAGGLFRTKHYTAPQTNTTDAAELGEDPTSAEE